MALLYLTDILKRAGLDISQTLLIRHALSNKDCWKHYESGCMKEYTQIQAKKKFPREYTYWVTFLSSGGNSAILDKCYKVKGYQEKTTNLVSEKFIDKKWFPENGICFDLEEIDVLREYEGRLVIDWKNGARNWKQKASNEKEIIALQSIQKEKFPGYENIILTYKELKTVVEDKLTYADWHAALSAVYGIYLIVDETDGKQYIGSASGGDGILQRWSMYVSTKHGNNKKMRELICDCPERYQHFRFSILQICPMTMTEKEVLDLESLYKKKLLTKQFGLNEN